MAGEFLLFTASTLLYQGARLVVSLVVAAWVGPEGFGAWNLLNLVLIYGVLVMLGVPNGINREVPLLKGKGDEDGARRVADLGFWFSLFASLAGGLLVLVAAFLGLAPGGDHAALFWCAPLFALWQLHQYLQMRLKSAIRFQQMSLQQILFALLLPLVALPLAWRWGLTGFVAGQAITLAVVCVYILSLDRPGRFEWRGSNLRYLIRVGWPIMAAGLLYSLLTSVDRWVILNTLGVAELGHYSLAILCLGSLSLFPAIISQQMYPRMAYRFGQTGDPHGLLSLVRQQTLIAGGVSAPVLLLVALGLPWVTARWLPAYLPGVLPAQILLVGLIAIALAGGCANLLNTIGQQRLYLTVQIVTIVVSLGLGLLLVSLGLGLNGVALGAAGAYLFYCAVLWAITVRALRREVTP